MISSSLFTTIALALNSSTADFNFSVIIEISKTSSTIAKSASALIIAKFNFSISPSVYCPLPDPTTAFSIYSLAIANIASYTDSSSATFK